MCRGNNGVQNIQEETVTERGIQLAKDGKRDEAREIFRKAIDEIPFDAALWCKYATIFLNEEKYGEAFPEFFESDRSLSGLSWREMTAG